MLEPWQLAFVEKLKGVRSLGWQIVSDMIRSGTTCPIIAVARQETGETFTSIHYLDAGEKIGLTYQQARVIQVTADGWFSTLGGLYHTELRAAMEEALSIDESPEKDLASASEA